MSLSLHAEDGLDRGGAGTPLLEARTLTKHFPLGRGAVVQGPERVPGGGGGRNCRTS